MLVSMQIVTYLFLGGASGGMLLTSSIWSLVFRHRRQQPNARKRLAFDTFFLRCAVLGTLTVLTSILLLFWDLGRGDRVFKLVFTTTPNLLTLGAVSLGVLLLSAAVLAVFLGFHVSAPGSLRTTVELVCAISALVVIVYTGLYLYSMEAVAIWHTPALIATFFFSSLSTGISLMLLVAYFTRGQAMLLGAVAPLQRFHVTSIALEAASIALLVRAAIINPAAAKSLAILTSPTMLPTAIVGVVVMALVIPCASELYALSQRHHRSIPAADIICLTGGFLLRFCIVACGVH
jgi:formate-dependent nitrite reductase membrane component NrfD